MSRIKNEQDGWFGKVRHRNGKTIMTEISMEIDGIEFPVIYPGITFTWTRFAVGQYRAQTNISVFTANKTVGIFTHSIYIQSISNTSLNRFHIDTTSVIA